MLTALASLILYIFSFENIRNLLAEQVYPLFSKRFVSLRSVLKKFFGKTFAANEHTVQWELFELRQVL